MAIEEPNKFISIVEDDDSLREALVGVLRSVGYKARGFACAETFLGVQDGQCGCIITDIRMPGLSGIEMTERLRAIGYDAPVILITARADAAHERNDYASGAICILRHTYEPATIPDCDDRALA